jgi:antitoxin component of RelBE/YafQ-DinJ toxin-antitoxin module
MDAILTVRLDKDVKEKALATLKQQGHTPSYAVQRLFDLIVATGGLPFDADAHPNPDEVDRRLSAYRLLVLDEPSPPAADVSQARGSEVS